MSQLIQYENQTLLWRLTQKIPEFLSMSSHTKDALFKDVMQQVYDSIPNHTISSREELQTYNRRVLTTLVSRVRPSVSPGAPTIPTTTPNISTTTNNTTTSSPAMFVESKEEIFQRQFQEKQHEYDAMFAKPVLPDASEIFQDKAFTNENRIDNMDQLLQQYESQRKQDMADVMTSIGPPPPQAQVQTDISGSIMLRVDALEQRVKQLEAGIMLLSSSSSSSSTTIEHRSERSKSL